MTKRALVWAAVSTTPQANEEEKFSIPRQVEDGKAFCQHEGAQIVDVLVVPGHSRDYRSLDHLAADARKKNIDAFDRLIEHFRKRDFDFLWCRDANRFARKASLLHFIAETIVEDCGALIYSQNDGLWVDEDNVDMWATMQGFKTRSEVKWFVRATKDGLSKRAERGLTTTRVPFSHIVLRDANGKPTGVVVDESKRRLFDDLFELMVNERTPFNLLERILYERFGHVDSSGFPYYEKSMYQILYHPLTWGHTCYGYTQRRKNGSRRRKGAWVFDDTLQPPDDVEVHRDTVPAVYTGEQAARLKAELRRRSEIFGNRRPATTFAFSGLFVCDECQYTLSIASNPRKKIRVAYALRCTTNNGRREHHSTCDQSDYWVSIDYLRKYVDELLRRLIITRDLSELDPQTSSGEGQLTQLESEIAALEQELESLIMLQGKAHPATQATYQKRIDTIGERLEILHKRELDVRVYTRNFNRQKQESLAALDQIEKVIDSIWTLDETSIHQLLSRLMGSRRFVVRDGVIMGIMSGVPRRTSRRKMIK